ncbi:MAG TPA: shikimate kinase, partial [Nitrospiria bacterium]|nr:shikimate kinase [Nitrospiria bacterium]
MARPIRQIVLTGFMGTGKSTVGQLLSRHYCAPFYDTDRLIEEKEKMSISGIFKRKGEPYFRKVESEVIRDLVSRPAELKVISSGGGVLLSDENVRNLKKDGILICLTADSSTILKRLREETGRPLLNVKNRLKEIERLVQIREARYKETADILLDTAGASPDAIVTRISGQIAAEPPHLPHAIEVPLGDRRYPILLGMGSLSGVGEYLGKTIKTRKVAVISNPVVWKLHGAALLKSLKLGGLEPVLILVPDGETTKSLKWVNHVIGEMLKNRM